MKLIDLKPEDIRDLVKVPGYSMVSNHILESGMPILFMYREDPLDEEDTGWRFLSGQEDQEYLDDPDNSKFIGVNTVANLDQSIIAFLKKPVGTELERAAQENEFSLLEDS